MKEEEFEFKKELIELESESKMQFASFIRETERLKHEWEKERMRIKNAEYRKNQERRANRAFMERNSAKDYHD